MKVKNFLEVKFSARGYIPEKSREVFFKYPTFILVVNLYFDENFFRYYSDQTSLTSTVSKEVRESRFHVWLYGGEEGVGEPIEKVKILTLENWLVLVLGIEVTNESRAIIRSYEELVRKWLQK